MKRLAYGAVLLLLLIGAFVVWWNISLSPVNTTTKTSAFVVAKGDGVREISKNLKDSGFIRDQVAFFLLIKKLGIEKNIQAGSFQLSQSMPALEIANKLTLGTEDIWVTIPEGWRSEEIIEYLQKLGLSEPIGNWDEEGKYFPETYLVPKLITIDEVRQLMRNTFDQKVPNLSDRNLILASLVEREGKSTQDRPIIAGILLNRLDAGMALDIDATVQYVVGYTQKDGWWKKELTLADLAIKSPYNTYMYPGLPPTAICNPGMASIQAILSPTNTDYLFYLTGKDGRMHYAKTNDEHNTNVAKYL